MATSMQQNVSRLRELAGSPETKKILQHFAERDRDREDTAVKRLMRIMKEAKTPVTQDALFKLFKELEELGYGNVVMGRNKKPSRFLWGVKLTTVGKTALGLADTVENYKPRNRNKALSAPKIKPAAPREYLNEVHKDKVTIRKGGVEIDVPSSASERTMQAIAALVDKL